MRTIIDLFIGKNAKLFYYVRCIAALLVPRALLRHRLKRLLSGIDRRDDAMQIRTRAALCCQLHGGDVLPQESSQAIGGLPRKKPSAYWLDAMMFLRFFPTDYRVRLVYGDDFSTQPVPSLVKTRQIVNGDTRNNVLLPLDRHRHFVRVRDPFQWNDKCDKAFFCFVNANDKRRLFWEKWHDNIYAAGGFVGNDKRAKVEWIIPPVSLRHQLRHKFIIVIEGNDVATNLKWVMSSNSIAVMPEPTVESWYLESRLIADYHYIRIADDFSDFAERVGYYLAHPDQAQAIIEHAHAYAAQFADARREQLTGLLTLQHYFDATGQTPTP